MIELFKQEYINAYHEKDIDPNIDMANYLVERMEYNSDQVIWFCFLNAITYQLPTAFLIMNEFPDIELAGIDKLKHWWTKDIQQRLPYQKDKLKQRKFIPETVESFKEIIGMDPTGYFDNLLCGTPHENFMVLWEEFYKPIKHFGRFSVWNFAQMLKQVAGYEIEPNTFFLGDSSTGSITKGACFLLGIDYDKKMKFSPELRAELERGVFAVMEDISKTVPINAFTMETQLCRFHKYYRERESRYIGYYLDRQKEDIDALKSNGWNGIHWKLLDDAMEGLNFAGTVQKERFKWKPEQKMGIESPIIGLTIEDFM